MYTSRVRKSADLAIRYKKVSSLYSIAGPNATHDCVAMFVHYSRPHPPFQVTAVKVQLYKKHTICSINIPLADRITQNELVTFLINYRPRI